MKTPETPKEFARYLWTEVQLLEECESAIAARDAERAAALDMRKERDDAVDLYAAFRRDIRCALKSWPSNPGVSDDEIVRAVVAADARLALVEKAAREYRAEIENWNKDLRGWPQPEEDALDAALAPEPTFTDAQFKRMEAYSATLPDNPEDCPACRPSAVKGDA